MLVLIPHPSQRLLPCPRDAALGPKKLRAPEGGPRVLFQGRIRGRCPSPGEKGRGTGCEAEAGPGLPAQGGPWHRSPGLGHPVGA